MIDEELIREILAQYKKHGWILRRVLLSTAARANVPMEIFDNAEIISSKVDALWFSRNSFEGRETWELRHLSAAPFALVEVFEDDDDEESREEVRTEVETLLKEKASKFRTREMDH